MDLSKENADETAQEIVAKMGEGIGISGTGISGCGPAVGLVADGTARSTIIKMLEEAIGVGVDALVVTAGIFVPPSVAGDISDEAFSLTFDIEGGLLGGKATSDSVFAKQQLPSNVVITTSANAVVAKSVAYDTSKAAANVGAGVAIELSPLSRVNAVAPTVVKGSAMFPRDRVIASLAKYEIEYSDSETDGAAG